MLTNFTDGRRLEIQTFCSELQLTLEVRICKLPRTMSAFCSARSIRYATLVAKQTFRNSTVFNGKTNVKEKVEIEKWCSRSAAPFSVRALYI